jgi:phage terminase large subunit
MSISGRTKSRHREAVSSSAAMKSFVATAKPFSRPTKKSGNDFVVARRSCDQTMESIMWNLIDMLYRGYCLARLREMRRFAHH